MQWLPEWTERLLNVVLAAAVIVQGWFLRRSKVKLVDAKVNRVCAQEDAFTVGTMQHVVATLREEVDRIRLYYAAEIGRLKSENAAQSRDMSAQSEQIRRLVAAHENCEQKHAELEKSVESYREQVMTLERKVASL